MTSVFTAIDSYFASTPEPPGWTTPAAAKIFASCVIALRPQVIVEIGVFGGRATIPIALALREVGTGVITAIDPWSKEASVKGMDGDNLTWWGNLDHEAIYQEFTKKVRELGVQNCVKVVRKTSDDAEVPDGIGVCLVDGNHSEQAIKDVARYCSKVIIGGLVYLDDLNWVGGKVKQAETNLLRMGFTQLYTLGTGGMYQRIK